jgi:hypothetical protein
MNLRWVHALLILLSAALAVLFGLWCLDLYRRQDGIAPLVAAIASFAAKSIHLGISRVLMTVALVLGGSSSAFACTVCFGLLDAEDSSMIDGTKVGILVLLGITLVVQGAFVSFFLYLRNRAKRIADIDLDIEWSELQGGATRT